MDGYAPSSKSLGPPEAVREWSLAARRSFLINFVLQNGPEDAIFTEHQNFAAAQCVADYMQDLMKQYSDMHAGLMPRTDMPPLPQIVRDSFQDWA